MGKPWGLSGKYENHTADQIALCHSVRSRVVADPSYTLCIAGGNPNGSSYKERAGDIRNRTKMSLAASNCNL